MAPVKTWITLTLLLLMPAAGAGASEPKEGPTDMDPSDPIYLILNVEASKHTSPDDLLCWKAARSRAFELWTEELSKGDLKTAEKYWGAVLTSLKAKGCRDCSYLMTIALQRTAMLDTKATGVLLWQHLLSATEHTVGPRDRYTGACCMHLAILYEGSKDYLNAVKYRKRQLSIMEEAWGSGSARALEAKRWVERDVSYLGSQKRRP